MEFNYSVLLRVAIRTTDYHGSTHLIRKVIASDVCSVCAGGIHHASNSISLRVSLNLCKLQPLCGAFSLGLNSADWLMAKEGESPAADSCGSRKRGRTGQMVQRCQSDIRIDRNVTSDSPHLGRRPVGLGGEGRPSVGGAEESGEDDHAGDGGVDARHVCRCMLVCDETNHDLSARRSRKRESIDT